MKTLPKLTNHDTERAEAGRYRYIRRTIRRQTENVAGKGKIDCRRTRRTEWNSEENAVCVGIWHKPASYRSTAESCRSPWNQDSDALAARLKKEFLRKLQNSAFRLLTSAEFCTKISPVIKDQGFYNRFLIPLWALALATLFFYHTKNGRGLGLFLRTRFT